MIDTEVLRKRTLEQAFKGKITRRSIDDENAGILYTHILSENKISNIENFEELYDIPDTWKWISLGNVGKWGAGATPSRKVKEYYGGNIPWLKTGDLNDGTINDIPEYITELALKETSVKINPIGSVLIAMYGATIGKLGILEIEATTNQACCACRTYDGIYNKYLFYYLMSQRENLKYMGSGGAQSNISKEKIVGFSFPLAPYAEQIRVVDAIEVIFSELDQIDKLQKQYSSDLEILKSKIIDAGIQGKLTEQLPEDGTAEELLKQIAEEKKLLIKEKKIKAAKVLPEITEDEISFGIPDNWKIVRVGDVLREIIVPQRDKPKEFDGDIPWCRIEDAEGIYLRRSLSNQNVSQRTVEEMNLRVFPKGTVLSACSGASIGRILITETELCTNQTFNGLVCSSGLYNKYLFYYLINMIDKLKKMGTGAAMAYISQDKTAKMVMPLPPYNEQVRIVDKIDEMLSIVQR